MVRPRLVEEGKPIGYDDDHNANAHDNHDHDDHEMMDDHHHHHSGMTAAAAASQTSEKKTEAKSSLLRAVGGKLPTPKPKKSSRSMKTVIGGQDVVAREDNDHHQHDDMSSSALPYDQHAYQQQHPMQHHSTTHFPAHAQHYVIGQQQPQPQQYPTMSHLLPLEQQQQPQHFQHSSPYMNDPYHSQQRVNSQAVTAATVDPARQAHHHHHDQQHRRRHHEIHYKPHRSHIEIGADYRPTERMEGVVVPDNEHRLQTSPLIVLDGANIAYAYADTLQQQQQQGDYYASSSDDNNNSGGGRQRRLEPDTRGISVACQYFLNAGIRVLVVLPAPWLRNSQDFNNNQQQQQQRIQILQELRQAGLLVMAPPTDDDDAYCLTIARRENARLDRGPAYVLSNDLFRDAQAREDNDDDHATTTATAGTSELNLRTWLNVGGKPGTTNNNSNIQTSSLQRRQNYQNQQDQAAATAPTGPGRISYTFVDMGQLDDYGDRQLDIVPNPRHALIAWIEAVHQRTIRHPHG